MKTNKTLKIISFSGIILVFGGLIWFFKPTLANIIITGELFNDRPEAVESQKRSYQQILVEGATPGLPIDHDFPTGFQYLNGCFGYSVGHILQDRGWEFDMLEMEEKIDKPRKDLWKGEYKKRLEEAYDLDFHWFKDAETLFYFLGKGEAVTLTYKLEDGSGILHAVAAYSFDEEGIWVSNSLSGKNERLPYEKIFTKKGDETLYGFGRVVEK